MSTIIAFLTSIKKKFIEFFFGTATDDGSLPHDGTDRFNDPTRHQD